MLRSATTTNTGESDSRTPSVERLTRPDRAQHLSATGSAWCRAMTVHVRALLTAKTMAPADHEGGEPEQRRGSVEAQGLVLAGHVQHGGGQAQADDDLGRLNRTLTSGLRETTSPTRTTAAAMATAVTGGADQQQSHHERPAGGDLAALLEAQPAQGPQLGDQAAGGENGQDLGPGPRALAPGRPRGRSRPPPGRRGRPEPQRD